MGFEQSDDDDGGGFSIWTEGIDGAAIAPAAEASLRRRDWVGHATYPLGTTQIKETTESDECAQHSRFFRRKLTGTRLVRLA